MCMTFMCFDTVFVVNRAVTMMQNHTNDVNDVTAEGMTSPETSRTNTVLQLCHSTFASSDDVEDDGDVYEPGGAAGTTQIGSAVAADDVTQTGLVATKGVTQTTPAATARER